MTLQKAIEINTKITQERIFHFESVENKAIKLGIEAMKFITRNRGYGAGHVPSLLPGETP